MCVFDALKYSPHHFERPPPLTRPLRPNQAQKPQKQRKKKPVDTAAPETILTSHMM